MTARPPRGHTHQKKETQFDNIVRSLCDPTDSEARQAAERTFEQFCSVPEAVVPLLCGSMFSADENVRGMCAVLIRKRVNRQFFELLCADSQATFKAAIIGAVQKEQIPTIRRGFADTLGEVASMVLARGDWPELLNYLFQAGKSDSGDIRESALLIFARLCFAANEKLVPFLPLICELFLAALQDDLKQSVQLAALNATAYMVQAFSSGPPHLLETLQVLAPSLLKVAEGALSRQDVAASRSALEDLISLAEQAPKFFHAHLDELIHFCFLVVDSNRTTEDISFLAVELLVTLAEHSPAMMRRQTVFVSNIVPLAMQLMLNVENVDPTEWNNSTVEADDKAPGVVVGKECLDRVALSLGGRALFPHAFEQEQMFGYLVHPDWICRHAGLIAISQMAEGCAPQMLQRLHSIVTMVVARIRDSHVRVRWAAINAIGQLQTDLAPRIQREEHAEVLAGLNAAMDDFDNPRIQAHAAAAVINFADNCDKHVLLPYLDGLLSKLAGLLIGGRRRVQEQALTAIAAVAKCAHECFRPYYPRIMPILKQMLVSGGGEREQRLLRGKTVECITLLGVAVGADLFQPDAPQILEELAKIYKGQLESQVFSVSTITAQDDPTRGVHTALDQEEDPQTPYLLQGWGQLASMLKEQVVPYLPLVIPSLLKSAGLKVDFQEDEGEDEQQEERDLPGITTVLLETEEGMRKVWLHNSAMEEKLTACSVLSLYLTHLPDHMHPWLDSIVSVTIRLVPFVYKDEIRSLASTTMPLVLRCALASAQQGQLDEGYVAQLGLVVVERLITAITEETSPPVTRDVVEAVGMCCSAMGSAYPPPTHLLQSGLDALAMVVEEVVERFDGRLGAIQSEMPDELEAEALANAAQHDEDLLNVLCTTLGQLIVSHRSAASGLLLPSLPTYLGLVEKEELRWAGIRAVGEALQGMGEGGQWLLSTALPLFISYSQQPFPLQVRRAAVWGLGVCAQHGGDSFAVKAADLTAFLISVISGPNARGGDEVYVTDKAAGAIAKILQYQTEAPMDRDAAMEAFVGYLPMGLPEGDTEEAVESHARLCSLLEGGDPVLISQPRRWIEPVVAIFGKVLKTACVDSATSGRIHNLLRMMQDTLPDDMVEAAFSSVGPEEYAKIWSICRSGSPGSGLTSPSNLV